MSFCPENQKIILQFVQFGTIYMAPERKRRSIIISYCNITFNVGFVCVEESLAAFTTVFSFHLNLPCHVIAVGILHKFLELCCIVVEKCTVLQQLHCSQ